MAAVLAEKPRSFLCFQKSNPLQGRQGPALQTPSRAPLSGFLSQILQTFCELWPQMLVPFRHGPTPPPCRGDPGPGRWPVFTLRRGKGQGCLTRSHRPGSQQGLARDCVRTVCGRRPGTP